MALTASQILSAIAPQFDTNPNRAVFLEMAAMQTSVSFFGSTKYERAVALRAAHEMMLAATRLLGETGSISSKSEGQLSVGFSGAGRTAPKGLESLLQTACGLELIDLIEGADLPARVSSGLIPGESGEDW